MRWEPSGVHLVPGPGYIAKNQSQASRPVEIFLPKLLTVSSVEENKTWCPVEALKWYIETTKDIRSSFSLFVSSLAPFGAVSKATISSW